jgi:pyruvate dehydrogenase E2 component (dihydrolipoamide acetyltransferase)
MRRDLVVPKLGLTMTVGNLLDWLVQPGDRFQAGQSIFIIESEKAAVEVPADADGVLLEAAAAVGATLTLGTVIGAWDDGLAAAVAPPAKAAPEPSPARPDGRLIATPLARRLAREQGIDLQRVEGSGPRGRIRARDLQAVPPAAVPAEATGAGTLRAASPTELTIARRLVSAKQEIPHFYLSVEAEVSELQKVRAELNAAQPDQRLTLNHFIVAAVGRALAQMPEVNRVWTKDGILSLPATDVGMAVHTERGLTVAILRDVGSKRLSEVARDAAVAATRAQAGRLSSADMAGGAITVSNAGMHDVTYMTSIINPGQSMILGVGSVRSVFRADERDQPLLRRELGMVLSVDHRVLDGVTALKFLKRVVAGLERPISFLAA